MKIRLIALTIAALTIALSSFTGCNGVGSTTKKGTPSPTIRVTERIGVNDSSVAPQSPMLPVQETISITDLPQTLLSAVISIVETVSVTDLLEVTPVPTEQQPLPQVTVTVTSPKTGTVWVVGTTQNIVWATTGEGISYVGIYYSIDNGKSMYTIVQKESNEGNYIWKVPNTPSKTVLVRVLAYNANGGTLALGDSGLFTISIQ